MIVFHFGPLSKDELTIDFDEEGAGFLLSKISALIDGVKSVEHFGSLHLFRNDLEEAIIELRLGVLDRLEMKKNSLFLEISLDAFGVCAPSVD